ncbi:MAG: hypothetical protein JWQ72_262 [Polaromonas sp.]|nr:hypothetical protein [Polaromonas sp.]
MTAEPQKEHGWLKQLTGNWTMTAEADMGPDKPAYKSDGTESARMLGSLWLVCEGRGDMPGGGTADMRMTLGYDTGRKKFVGNWVGSMMANMFVYEGQLDDSGKVLTLDTEGPSFKGDGSTSRYQDVITLDGPDRRTLHSQVQQPDGSWKRFMLATYRRAA